MCESDVEISQPRLQPVFCPFHVIIHQATLRWMSLLFIDPFIFLENLFQNQQPCVVCVRMICERGVSIAASIYNHSVS